MYRDRYATIADQYKLDWTPRKSDFSPVQGNHNKEFQDFARSFPQILLQGENLLASIVQGFQTL